MDEPTTLLLEEQTVLLVEDDLLVGTGLRRSLEGFGATVVWCTTLARAMDALMRRCDIALAIVDVNLAGELSMPVLDRLMAMGFYTIVSTGYDAGILDERYKRLPFCEKPFTHAKMRSLLIERWSPSPLGNSPG